MATADVRIEWLEAPGAGAGNFRPLTGRGVLVDVTLADENDGAPTLTVSLKPEAR
jgi:hypothetical protein